jgi:hypothetical protein
MNYFFGPWEVWRKLPAGGWVELATRSVSFNCLSPISQTECWFTDGNVLQDRYIHGSGFTTWNIESLGLSGVVEFRQSLLHAYASNDVLAIGVDGSTKFHTARWNGSAWVKEATTTFPVAGNYVLGALHAIGNTVYIGFGEVNFGNRVRLYKHTNKGIGGGWTEVGGTGWPTNNRMINGIWVNPFDVDEIWVCFGLPSATGPDIVRSTDGGSNWTQYTRGDSTYGCASIWGDPQGNVWIGHNQSGNVSVWNGSVGDWAPDESSGSGGFTGAWWGPGADVAYQRIFETSVADADAPVVSNQTPSPSDTGVDRDTNILLDITDAGTGVDDSTVILTVNGTVAWTGDAQQPGFAVTKTPITDGFRYEINPDSSLPELTVIPIRVQADDLTPSPNSLDTTYSFTTADITAPTLQNRDPSPAQTGVAASANVVLEIVDLGGLGVDAASVILTVGGSIAWTGDAQQAGFAVTKSVVTDGFRYEINPDTDFAELTAISVRVQADDLAASPNSVDTTYSFTTADVTAPTLQNQSPAPSDIGVPRTSNVVLEIVDTSGTGINAASVVLTVAGSTAWTGDAAQPGFSVGKSAVTDGFRYTINPDTDFPYSTTIQIGVVASDNATTPNTLNTSYSFSTVPVTYSFTIASIVGLTSATPIGYSLIRMKYSTAMKRDDPLADDDATNPSNYLFTGGFRIISARNVEVVSADTFDVTVDEMTDGAAYNVAISTSLIDEGLSKTVGESLVDDPDADNADFTGLGEPPRLISVTNPAAGILHVDFSEAMNIDNRLLSPGSYAITPVGEAKPILVNSVTASASLPTRTVIGFQGGGSPYTMTITGPIDEAGNPISLNNSVLFNVGKPGVDELFEGEQLYFETDLGAIKFGFTELTQRRIEDLVFLRSQSIGYEEQFKTISESLKEAGINRDDTKLNLFKG